MQKDLSLTITVLSACIQSCDEFHENLLLKNESQKVKRLSGLCSDCSEFCSITIDFINRESSITKKMLRFCSEICHNSLTNSRKLLNMMSIRFAIKPAEPPQSSVPWFTKKFD